MFTDAHVADESFLELINNMLMSGMVLALFKEDEKEGMISRVKKTIDDGRSQNWYAKTLLNYYVKNST